MSDPVQIAAEVLAETWRSGNRKDAIDGLLGMQTKVQVAQAVFYFYQELAGAPSQGTSARYETTVLGKLLQTRKHGG